MEDYTKKQVSEITGLAPRLVQFYTEEGVVSPDIDEGKGRGKFRRYSIYNVFQFGLINELTHYGINLTKLKDMMEQFKHVGKTPNSVEELETFLLGDYEPETRNYFIVWKAPPDPDNFPGGLSGGVVIFPDSHLKGALIEKKYLKEVVSCLVIDMYALYKTFNL